MIVRLARRRTIGVVVSLLTAGLFLGTSSCSSGGGALNVTCRDWGVDRLGAGCECDSKTNGSGSRSDCSPSSQAKHDYGSGVVFACCAGAEWPEGDTCSCTPLGCDKDDRTCACHALTLGSDTSSGSECIPEAGWHCCQDESGCFCGAGECSESRTEVSDCHVDAIVDMFCASAGFGAVKKTEETLQVESCSPAASGGGVDPPATGTAGSSGTGTGSCPEKAYKACSSGSDCPCTGYCGRITSNDSTKYCTIECTTDAECVSTPNFKVGGGGCNPLMFTCLPG